jgi:tRNA(Ile)-lysidine synthase
VSTASSLLDDLLARCRFPSDPVVRCAVSGGPDSLALLVLASAAGRDVIAIHVDHGLRAGSAAESEVVAGAAERFGARFEARRAVVAPGPNLEERARDARYAVLPIDTLIGHTADDQAETVLLNLVRGAGPRGLGAMRPDRRPLLALRRAETHALCADLGLRPVMDPSNSDPAHRRNRVRHELLPLLADVAGTDVVPVIARMAVHQRDVADLLTDLGAGVDPRDGVKVGLLDPLVGGEVLRCWWADETGLAHAPGSAAIGRMLEVARGEIRATDVAEGWRLERTAGRLRLVPPAASHSLGSR